MSHFSWKPLSGSPGQSVAMRIHRLSGEEVASLPANEVAGITAARAVKERLQEVLGISIYRQRLLRNGNLLADDLTLELQTSQDVQLVLVPFQRPTGKQLKTFQSAAALNRAEAGSLLLSLIESYYNMGA